MTVSSHDSSRCYEERYKMLMESVPSSVLFFNMDLRILSANRSFLEKLQRSESDTIGFRLEEIFSDVTAGNEEFANKLHKVFDENRSMPKGRITYLLPEAAEQIFDYNILPFCRREIVESAMLLMEDVTEKVRLSEENDRLGHYLASVVEGTGDIVLSVDGNGRILTWNTSAEKISGYLLAEVKGRFLFQYYEKDAQKEIKEMLTRIGICRCCITAEWHLITQDGNSIPVHWTFSPTRGRSSQQEGIVAVGRNLSERRKLGIQLLQSQKLAALGIMAGAIAHEIRTPLAICSSFSQFLMEESFMPEFQKECVEKINSGILKASLIIEKLLKFSRPSKKTEFTLLNLLSLIKETGDLVANQAKLQKITLKYDFPDGPLYVNGNVTLLQQVFLNLFLNAISAMPDGGILIVWVDTFGNAVLIHVSDTGYGIAENNIDKIFDPFHTASSTGKGTGTGLGLSICYSIVKEHLGSITAASDGKKGSTFTIKLPLHLESSHEE